MTTMREFLDELSRLHVKVWDDDGYLGYSAPEASLTPVLLEQLRERKAELLAFLRLAEPTHGQKPLQPVPRQGDIPVSMAQRRLWFVSQLEGATVAYNMPGVFKLTGQLNTEALQQSLSEIVRRHESLRTTFSLNEKGPIQVIHPPATVPLPIWDVKGVAGDASAVEVQRLIQQEVHYVFDLETGPLLRACLLRLGPASHVLVIIIHHIVADGWSLGVFVRELTALYKAFSQGQPSPLPALPIQYADFSQWQWERFSGDALEEQLAYWRDTLADLSTLVLPTAHPRPTVETFQGNHYFLTIDRRLIKALKASSQQEGVTLYMTLLAAFKVLLYRYSNQEDIAVGSGTANRDHPDIENLIGFFVNTLVIRTDLSGNPTFQTVLQRVRQRMLEATEHQDLPFERIVDELGPERDLRHNPLVQVGIVLQNYPMTEMRFPGLTLTPMGITFNTAKLDLMLLITESESGLEVVMEYNTDLFNESTVKRIAAHFETLLAGIVANPTERIACLPLLTQQERHQLLVEWNDTDLPCPKDKSFYHAFEEHVIRHPDAVAVVFDTSPTPVTLTYRDLNERANQLAHYLVATGVGLERLVGIHIERSVEMIVAFLGVLKAGGAYVPLDPNYPNQRLAFIIADAQVQVLLTQTKWVTGLPEHSSEVICLDREWPIIQTYPHHNPDSRVTGSNLAYIIYTSGSTGQPKGSLVPHKDLWSVAKALADAYALTPKSRVLQFASLNFDGSVVEITMTLFRGATLYLAPQEHLLPGAELSAFLQKHAITHVQLPPSLLARLPTDGLSHLQTIMVAGEASSVAAIKDWLPGRRIINGYGPTEVTVGATMMVLTEADAASLSQQEALPIGQPFYNKRVYVLDQHLQPVPIGVSGELYIDTPGLARGYLNRPGLTAKQFIPNPFSDAPGARLYKTGDLVRYLPDGNLVFLGRIDNQVKIRGLRIELEEIENALQAVPQVSDAAVVVHDGQVRDSDTQEEKHLVAYVVPKQDWKQDHWQAEHICNWQTLHEQLLHETRTPADIAFNISGWKSTYTGDDIPEAEMRLWVASTVERILACDPHCVLEVGCGTGLLLSRLAPRVREYWGTDLSFEAIQYVAKMKDVVEGLDHVVLLHRPADDFADMAAAQFDTIVLNSVVQYFPSLDYLLAVLQGAIRILKPGGTIFVGDVRSLPLLEAYHASVELFKAPESLSKEEFRYRVQRGMMNENELVIDPKFFTALKNRFLHINQVHIVPKRGCHRNELVQFRYDVTMKVGAERTTEPDIKWHDWDKEGFTLDGLRQLLIQNEPRVIGVRGIPNARLQTEIATLEWLHSDGGGTVGQWQSQLVAINLNGCEPEALWALERDFPYNVHLSWSDARCDGSLGVILIPIEMSHSVVPPLEDMQLQNGWSKYTNNPLQVKVRQELGPHLRRHLQKKLPPYMVPATFVVLPALPLTSNGKVDRRALPAPDIEQRSRSSDYVAPRTEVEARLVSTWTKVLGIEHIGVCDNFFDLGGDSILSIQIAAQAKQAGLTFTSKQLFENQTITELATVAETSQAVQIEQGLVTGPVPLTPIQRWFFAQNGPEPHHFNQAILVEVCPDMSSVLLKQALQHIVTHHDALRLRFTYTDASWQQINLGVLPELSFEVLDLSHLTTNEQKTAIKTTTTERQKSLNLSDGPLMRVVLFTLGDNQAGRLLWVIHHLVVDGVSWRILLNDLTTAYQQLQRGQAVQLSAKTTSYKQWAERLSEYAQTEALKAELEHWRFETGEALPIDVPAGANSKDSVAEVQVSLSTTDTQALLHNVPHAYNTQINDVLLTALVSSFAEWTGDPELVIDLEGHGREELFDHIDLSRTVGWFTTLFPVRLKLIGNDSGEALKAIKEQLRAIPNQGIGYGLLRYLSQEKNRHDWPMAQVGFNYLGQFDQIAMTEPLLDFAKEDVGPTDSAVGLRTHLFQINGMVMNGCLQFTWTYSRSLYRPYTVQRLADGLIDGLKRLIRHCLSPQAGGYTPNDFPTVALTQTELDSLVAQPGANNRNNIEAIYPLTPLQEGLLFHSMYAPDEAVYATQLVFTIQSKLDTRAFRQAWQHVVARHQLLRSQFVWKGRERPLQVALREVDLPWQDYDWRHEANWEQRLTAFVEAEQTQGIALDQPPIIRLALIQTAAECYHFVWYSHHILLDGWSSPIILKDVLTFYKAITRGEDLYLAPPPRYDAYITWLQQQDVARSAQFWRETLRGFTAPTPLVVESKTPTGVQGHRHDRFRLTAEAMAALKALAEDNRITLNTVVQGVWALLLSRYSGLDDVLFGATVSGREAEVPGIEEMVGLFINTLPVRVKIEASRSIKSWLKDLQVQQVKQREYQYASLVAMQGWSDVPGGTQLFNSMLVFENYPLDDNLFNQDELYMEETSMASPTHYPLVVGVIPYQELEVLFDYDTSRFEVQTIARMAGHFTQLLSGMAENPEARVGELSLLTAEERQQLLVAWNDTRKDYSRDQCFHQRFEEQVKTTPAVVALVGPSLVAATTSDAMPPVPYPLSLVTLTYYELNTRANQLAHYLQSLGIGPEVLVGVCMERSIEMVIGLLAIFKAGGAYVPLDPAYPQERLAFMMDDAQVKVLLTQTKLRQSLPEHTAQIVDLDTQWDQISLQPKDNPTNPVKTDNLAYVIYTSGSTGMPKGVLVTHCGLFHLTPALIRAFGVTAESQVLQYASLNFDGSISEVVMAFGAGATLHVAASEQLMPGPDLQQILRERGITHLTLLPAALRALSPEGLPELETLIVTGEACSASLIREWARGRRFINAYGPTEITVAATTMLCTAEDDSDTVPYPSIGRPIENTEIYILDKERRPVPIGVPGDLYIGGIKLTRGYLNQPGLTGEQFLPHPFSDQPGARVYSTGDLAYYLPDGNIGFLGRADSQVKVRGYRIELGEIEAVLNGHPQVQEAAVIVQTAASGDNRLLAYWVAQEAADPTPTMLRDFLSQRLLDYMVPAIFVKMDALPLNPNGKVDRGALPEPDDSALEREEFVAPRTSTEETLADIWAEVLGLERVGIHDHFFDLGGHSLLAMNLMMQIEEHFDQRLPMATLFEAPTIEALANKLDETPSTQPLSPVIPIHPEGDQMPFFCVPGLGVHVFYLHQLAQQLGTDQPFYGLQPLGTEGETPTLDTMEALIGYLIDAIQQVQPEGPYHVGGHSAGARIAFALALALQQRGHEVPVVTILDMRAPQESTAGAKSQEWEVADNGLIGYVELVKRALGDRLALSIDHLQSLDEEPAWHYAVEGLQAANLLPPKAGVEQLKHMAALNQQIAQMVRAYVPQETYQGQLLVFAASEAMPDGRQMNVEGWQNHCTNPIAVHTVPGDHMTMLREPHVQVLAKRLGAAVEASQSVQVRMKHMSEASTRSMPPPGPIPTPPDFPVTWDDPADAERMWFYNKTQYPAPITPLDFSIGVRGMVTSMNKGNQAYNLPFVADARLINTYAYMTNLPDTALSPEALARQMEVAVEKVSEVGANLQTEWDEVWLPEIQEHLSYWTTYDLSGATFPALMAHLEETDRRVARLWEVHTWLIIPIMLALSSFEEVYQDVFETAKPSEAYYLVAGFGNKTVESGHQLWALSRQVLASPVVRQVLNENDPADVAAIMAETSEGRVFWEQFEAYLQEFGQRSELMYLDIPSWLEDPTPVIKSLQDYISQPERDLTAEMEALAKRRETLVAEVRAQLASYPQPVAAEFERALTAAQVANVLSEDHNYWLDQKMYFHTRQVCLELGKRLVEMGWIDQQRDVFYLTLDELRTWSEVQSLRRFRKLISERQAEAQQFASCTPSPVVGTLLPMPLLDDPISKSALKFSGFVPVPSEADDEIRGYPGSGGQVQGTVKVLRTLSEATKLKPGDILVTSATSTTWTTLFASVAAVVTDTGGPLCHAAVVAREYNIPAVVGTQAATTRLQDGQTVEVDGDVGSVRLL
ncbi:Chondramide synthase cmdD [Candidatus Entotheonellaceae bacterium PAL068K]